MSLKCWNAADMTFERDTLEGSITKGICYLSPVTHVPRDRPLLKTMNILFWRNLLNFWNPNWPQSVFFWFLMHVNETSFPSQHIRVSMSNGWSEMNLMSTRCHRFLLLSLPWLRCQIFDTSIKYFQRSECCSTTWVEWWVCSAAPSNFQMAAEVTLLL